MFFFYPKGACGSLEAPWGILWGLWDAIGHPWRVLGDALGGPRGCSGVFGDPWGGLGGSYGAIGGLMKTLKHHFFLLCFEHVEVLGWALGLLVAPWGLL